MTKALNRLAAAVTIAGFAAAAAPAFAQDDQPSPWSGIYGGVLLGGAWGEGSITRSVSGGNGSVVIPPTDVTLINATSVHTTNHAGFTGGGELGYNYKAGSLLLGAETDFTAVDTDQTTTSTVQSPLLITPPLVYTLDEKAQTDWMWTIRGRIGYVAGPLLLYGTAGFALSEIKVKLNFADNLTPPNVIASDNSSTRAGWVVGGGVGYALSQNWSVKTEFLYADFGGITTGATSANGYVTLNTHSDIHPILVRLGIDYRFW
jgi:outer membrane immunogenic protein